MLLPRPTTTKRWRLASRLRLLRKRTKLRRITGALGECFAAAYLRRQGYEIWLRNWSCKAGEIDILAFKGHTLIVVEVKTRIFGHPAQFSPFDSIGAEKCAHLNAAVDILLREHKRDLKLRHLREVRIDALGISIFVSPRILPLKLVLEHREAAVSVAPRSVYPFFAQC